MSQNPAQPRLRTSWGATTTGHQPTTMYGMATTHCGASSHTWRSAMPAAAPAHTMASRVAWDHPVSANPATAVLVPAMPMKIALWSARRIRRHAGADQRSRWKAALVPNITSMPAT